MAAINQKEYLKKYLGIGKSEKKKKKKPKIYGDRLKIVDDNIDVSLSQEIQEDIDAGNEDAPLIVSVIDDTKGTMWQPIGSTASTGTGNSQLIVDTFKLNKSANETSLAKSVKHKADLDVRKKCPSPDVSPPRRRDMTPPLRVKQERISPDTSPPRNRIVMTYLLLGKEMSDIVICRFLQRGTLKRIKMFHLQGGSTIELVMLIAHLLAKLQ
ncbi:unnamed protein product [Acanthoscelides obtectus]|uniref:Uncharacterized protein n=1 Tax=Acanthoscelides obtectus TaxID=200917 RepID=A0A9P0M193_ACAOB|nr:unnamed protein product [Acanthoscelides obtectus]CAK1632791.1 hypothetical protein AOBTE_LOCUS7732 [Acanthoscelides obtectus]